MKKLILFRIRLQQGTHKIKMKLILKTRGLNPRRKKEVKKIHYKKKLMESIHKISQKL